MFTSEGQAVFSGFISFFACTISTRVTFCISFCQVTLLIFFVHDLFHVIFPIFFESFSLKPSLPSLPLIHLPPSTSFPFFFNNFTNLKNIWISFQTFCLHFHCSCNHFSCLISHFPISNLVFFSSILAQFLECFFCNCSFHILFPPLLFPQSTLTIPLPYNSSQAFRTPSLERIPQVRCLNITSSSTLLIFVFYVLSASMSFEKSIPFLSPSSFF